MRRFAAQSERCFGGDSRYDLQNVAQGFSSRLDASSDDTELLKRICRAYARSASNVEAERSLFGPTSWWKRQRERRLGPVMQALRECDTCALRAMYANFFRDRCSSGLIKAYFEDPIREIHLKSYLGDALYRLDYWLAETGGRHKMAELAGPKVGNPFGVVIDDTLVQYGAEYQHYCAHRVLSCLDGSPKVVGEIGGGYGGMAYFLLRAGAPVRYIGFDLPESLALASYYLMKSLPSARFLLYGEADLTADRLAAFDVVLLPLFEMARVGQGSIGLTFSAHVMGDLSDDAVSQYLDLICRMTTHRLLYLGDSRAADRLVSLGDGHVTLVAGRSTGWNRHEAPEAEEGEYLYRLGRG
ncbi:MAG TPA: putative sugar O-methyltransferase [Bryobacteraceae bacterium]|nr:putative sugar O-methyltransferase [Bryobacteraceae bacterium]